MTKLIKFWLAAIFIGAIFFLSGCNASTTYYGGYYDPYPRWGYRHSHHDNYRPGRPTPRPTPRPMPRAR